MLRWILASSLQFRFLVLAAAIALMIFGVTRLPSMAVDVLPEFAPPFIEVQTEAPGLAASEVESLITVPIEEILNGVPWIQTMRSQSVVGLSSIILLFEPGTNISRARQMVQERLAQAQGLPSKKVAKAPVMLQPLSASSRVMMVGLTSKQLSLIELSVLTRWNIRPRLNGVPGVANVSVWGQRDRQLQVQVDPAQLKQKGVKLDQIIATAGNAMWVSPLTFLPASTPGSGGFVDMDNQRLGITHLLPITSPKDLARVNVEGTKLLLGEVAQVKENHQPLIGDAVINGTPGLLLVIDKFPGASTLEVAKRIEATLEALRPGLSGVTIESQLFQPASFIETAFDSLARVFWIAALLVMLVIFAFLMNWRSLAIGLAAMISSFAAALFVLFMTGAMLNAMVLLGLALALGAIIDDAISDVDALGRRLAQARLEDADKPMLAMILESMGRTRTSAVYATLIVILAALPIYALTGFQGAFFGSAVTAYLIAILASMGVALTLTPALCLLLHRHDPDTVPEPEMSLASGWPMRLYDGFLASSVAKPMLALAVVAVIAVVGAVALPQLRQGTLLPEFKSGDLVVAWSGQPGVSRELMVRTAKNVTRDLRTIPGVRSVASQFGRAVTADEVVGLNAGKLWINLDPQVNRDQVMNAIQSKLEAYPELGLEAKTYLRHLTDNAQISSNHNLVVRIYGQEFDTLNAKAGEIKKALEGIGGITTPQIARQTEEQILEVAVNLADAQSYGLKPGDIRRVATTLVNGIEVGNLFEAQKVFDVLVVGQSKIRTNVETIKQMLIDTPGGTQVKLSDVADISFKATPSLIRRESNSRWLDVVAGIRGRDFYAVAGDVQAALKEIQFPLEYNPEVLGAAAGNGAGSAWGFAVAAAIGAFLLLQAACRSWRLAFVSLLMNAAALLGGAIALWLFAGGTLSLSAALGFLAVLGLAVRHQITLIQQYQHLEHHEGVSFGAALVQHGTREHVPAMLTTIIATALCTIAASAIGGPGLEILQALSVVVLGGLLTSSVVNLLVLPAVYLWLRETPEPEFDFTGMSDPNPAWLPNVRSADATD